MKHFAMTFLIPHARSIDRNPCRTQHRVGKYSTLVFDAATWPYVPFQCIVETRRTMREPRQEWRARLSSQECAWVRRYRKMRCNSRGCDKLFFGRWMYHKGWLVHGCAV